VILDVIHDERTILKPRRPSLEHTRRRALKTLTICCPHIAEPLTPNTLIVEGGPLTLSPEICLMRGSFSRLLFVQEEALRALQAWMRHPGSALLHLAAHPICKCCFLATLDRETTLLYLRALGRELHEDLYGHPQVTTRVVELNNN